MKKPRLLLLAPLVLGGVALAGICWGVLLSSIWWYRPPPPVGVVLVYEVDPEHQDPGRPVDMDRLVAAIDGRVNPGGRDRNGQVRHLDDGRIEVGIFGDDPAKVRRIERILGRIGTLEFRILASRRDKRHARLLKRAASVETAVVRDIEGRELGRWVPIQAGQEENFEDYFYGSDAKGRKIRLPESQREVAIRETVRRRERVLEVLVVKDPFDVDGRYLTDARGSTDEYGDPCVRFQFDSTGGRLFGRLTSRNLPDEVQDFYRKMGIILDGRLYSAPRINSTIYDQGVIEGSFTQAEVNDLVTVLNAGSLPAVIRQVEKRKVGSEQ
ncbi:MAG: SecDF P1 head subdomain-containing protein [Planctomycetota bacterium]|jgi:SecD/SecF fusion protein